MATTRTQQAQPSSPAMIVLVIESDDDIRHALVDLLEDEGYGVLAVENLRTAENLIDTVSAPLVLLVGDDGAADYGGLEYFTMVAANPVTKRAYIYLCSTPERCRLPALVQMLKTLEIPIVDKLFEVASLLSIVATTAERVCS